MSERTSVIAPDQLALGEKLANETKQDTMIASLATIATGVAPVSDTPEYFEDTNFVTGDSPITLDINTALGRNATNTQVINDGPGSFTIESSTDGAAFGDPITIKASDPPFCYEDIDIDSIRITWVADSAYRVIAI